MTNLVLADKRRSARDSLEGGFNSSLGYRTMTSQSQVEPFKTGTNFIEDEVKQDFEFDMLKTESRNF